MKMNTRNYPILGQTCLYSSGRVALSQSNFKARDGAVTAFLFKKGKVAVLESPTFRLNVAARIHFLYRNEASFSPCISQSLRISFFKIYLMNTLRSK